jgi:hypothetical protein
MAYHSTLLAELLGDPYAGFEPKMADRNLSNAIFTDTRDIVKFYGRQLLADGWRFYGVRQNCGRCYGRPRVITIPAWVLTNHPVNYKEWYVCHEMAHAYNMIDGTFDIHGPNFMYFLKTICPADCVHYELGYKPRNAASAGIRDPRTVAKQPVRNILDDIL